MRYFSKAIISNPIFTDAGKPIPFVHVGSDDGVIATDDNSIIESLASRVKTRRGGVSELTQEQYDEIIKKKSDLPSPRRSHRQGVEPFQVLPQDPIQAIVPPPVAPVAEVVAAEKPKAKSDSSRPATAKVKG